MRTQPSASRLPVAIGALTMPVAGLGHVLPGTPGAGWLVAGGLTLAAVGWSVTRRSRHGVAVVARVANVAAITAGQGEGPVRAMEATPKRHAISPR